MLCSSLWAFIECACIACMYVCARSVNACNVTHMCGEQRIGETRCEVHDPAQKHLFPNMRNQLGLQLCMELFVLHASNDGRTPPVMLCVCVDIE